MLLVEAHKKTIVAVIALVGVGAAALLWLPTHDSTRIKNEILIARQPDAVFAYVTTPGNWPKWHPASKAVTGAIDHSLAIGEKVTEDFMVAGRAGQVVWTAIRGEPPRVWVIKGDVNGRNAGVITYSLTPAGDGTLFEREFIYPSPNLLFALLNWISIKARVQDESDQALRNLKRVLERRS